jgi:hypothetical protein
MTIRIPTGLAIAGTALVGTAMAAFIAKQVPELVRFFKAEGM